jgi:hypothetical protein
VAVASAVGVAVRVGVRVGVPEGVSVTTGVTVSVGVRVTVAVGVAVSPVTTIRPSLTTAGMYPAKLLARSTTNRRVLLPESRARKAMLPSTPLPLTGAAGESSE